MRPGLVIVVLATIVASFLALTAIASAAPARRPVSAYEVRGNSKVTDVTLRYLTRIEPGDPVGPEDIALIEQSLISSELFEKATVTLEDGPNGTVIIVATLEDKQSWIVAPTLFVLPGSRAVGVGYAENDLGGNNQKLLLYGQIGDTKSLFFGTFLDPSVRGTRWRARFDLYAYRRTENEYLNPAKDPQNFELARITTATYLGGGALVGYAPVWWLSAELRVRGGYVYLRDPHIGEGANRVELPVPDKDGIDISVQPAVTLDQRGHRYGVTWGAYVQLMLDASIPGLDQFGYQGARLRAYYSWRLFGEHELEIRGIGHVGRHLPFHEELTLGGQYDLRGYAPDQFRGDVTSVLRVEYSVPLVRWRWFSFRGIGFFDGGYSGKHFIRDAPERNYLPNQHEGLGYTRTDVGAGLRVYVSSVVLPLLGLDFAYGIEGHSPEVLFEVGLTDF